MNTIVLSVLKDNVLIADDTSVIKIFNSKGISLYGSKSDAIRGCNASKVFSPIESLEFLEKSIRGLNGSAMAIDTINKLQAEWKIKTGESYEQR